MGKENEVVIPLKTLLDEHDKEKVKTLLDTFSCSKNLDVENFFKKLCNII